METENVFQVLYVYQILKRMHSIDTLIGSNLWVLHSLASNVLFPVRPTQIQQNDSNRICMQLNKLGETGGVMFYD